MPLLGQPMSFLIFLTMLVIAVVFGSTDARKRGKSPVLIPLLILCSFPLGLLVWLVFRPAPVQTGDARQGFNLEDRRLP